jgi:ribose-phosphate pyrophosphokinase
MIMDSTYTKFNFPAGEMHIQLVGPWIEDGGINDVEWTFEKNEDIIELLLYCNAMKEHNIQLGKLTIPYVPFGRQDRVSVPGESFSLRMFCELVNNLNAESVEVWDPHSDVIPALINRCSVVTQASIFAPIINTRYSEWVVFAQEAVPYFIISPDGGALKKIYKLTPHLNHCQGVIECSKLRNVKTGEITETKVHAGDFEASLEDSKCIIVDDICDGGRTFIEISKVLKTKYRVNSVILCVTHGLFTKGLDVFDGIIDEIFTRNGRVK